MVLAIDKISSRIFVTLQRTIMEPIHGSGLGYVLAYVQPIDLFYCETIPDPCITLSSLFCKTLSGCLSILSFPSSQRFERKYLSMPALSNSFSRWISSAKHTHHSHHYNAVQQRRKTCHNLTDWRCVRHACRQWRGTYAGPCPVSPRPL